jgi:hypothetical protein
MRKVLCSLVVLCCASMASHAGAHEAGGLSGAQKKVRFTSSVNEAVKRAPYWELSLEKQGVTIASSKQSTDTSSPSHFRDVTTQVYIKSVDASGQLQTGSVSYGLTWLAKPTFSDTGVNVDLLVVAEDFQGFTTVQQNGDSLQVPKFQEYSFAENIQAAPCSTTKTFLDSSYKPTKAANAIYTLTLSLICGSMS